MPTALGRYELIRLLAEGGMSTVHLARARGAQGFSRLVAIKSLLPSTVSSRATRSLLAREARVLASLHHPNVAQVLDFFETDDGACHLVLELLEGHTVARLASEAWDRGELPVEISARIIADAARGLYAAHKLSTEDGSPAGVVHRDVSPSNLFVLEEGLTKVLDFGVARAPVFDDPTEEPQFRGRRAYASPEQLALEPLDGRADIYALGGVFWELVVGQRLVRSHSDKQSSAPEAPSSVRSSCPASIDALVLRALAPRREDRYATAEAMADAIEAWLAREHPSTTHAAVSAYQSRLFAGSAPAAPAPAPSVSEPKTLSETRVASILGVRSTRRAASIAVVSVVAVGLVVFGVRARMQRARPTERAPVAAPITPPTVAPTLAATSTTNDAPTAASVAPVVPPTKSTLRRRRTERPRAAGVDYTQPLDDFDAN
ncbi:MAG: serine/threonine protein kinase [Myxococcales bacterium]|nr:serine/threonine protein kinase [Myxococcales bacterium]